MPKTTKNIKIVTKKHQFHVKNHQKYQNRDQKQQKMIKKHAFLCQKPSKNDKIEGIAHLRARARTREAGCTNTDTYSLLQYPYSRSWKKKAKNACFSSWDEVIFFLCDSKLGPPPGGQNRPRDPKIDTFWAILDPPGTPPRGVIFDQF